MPAPGTDAERADERRCASVLKATPVNAITDA